MARSRNIKPGFYKEERLAECTPMARLAAPGLWMLADREGRLEDRPKRLKADIFPYDAIDLDPLLSELAACGHIVRYEVNGQRFIQIVNFLKHQKPHKNEVDSIIPPPSAGVVLAPRPEPFVPRHETVQTKDKSTPASYLLPLTSSLNPSSDDVVRAREDSDFSIPPPSTPKTMPPPQASGIHQEVRSYISQKLPHLAVKPSFVIDEWLAQGADPDRDIYPAVDRLVDMKRGDIGSYKFFTNAILKSLEDWREQEETYRKVEALYAN